MPPPKRARTLAEVDDALAGLARAVERHSRMITSGRQETAALAATVDQLATSLRVAVEAWATADPAEHEETGPDQQQRTEGASPRPNPQAAAAGQPDDELPSWLLTTDWEIGERLTTELTGWVRQVYLRWPDAQLPTCWSLHPWVVEELWVLRCCWTAARTGEGASWLRWQDWHDRQRPATTRRIADGLQHCSPAEHTPPSGGPYPAVPGADVVPLAVTAWATEDHQSWPPLVGMDLLTEPGRNRSHSNGGRPPVVPRRTLT